MNKEIQESWIVIDKHLERSFKTLSGLVSKGDKTAALDVMKLFSAVLTIRDAVGLEKDDYGNILIKPKKKKNRKGNNKKAKSGNEN